MFQFLRQLWHRLCARLRFCGGVQYLAGTACLPSPLSAHQNLRRNCRQASFPCFIIKHFIVVKSRGRKSAAQFPVRRFAVLYRSSERPSNPIK